MRFYRVIYFISYTTERIQECLNDTYRNDADLKRQVMTETTWTTSSAGPGSFRPWVVSPLSRFARGSFRPGSFRPGPFRPWVVSPYLVSRFALSFLPCPNVYCGILFVIYNLRICLSFGYIYKRTLKTPHYKLVAMMIISQVLEYRIFRQKWCQIENKIILFKFHTKTGTSTPVIYVMQYAFNRYQKFNKNKLWGRKIFTRSNMISRKKHKKLSKCC